MSFCMGCEGHNEHGIDRSMCSPNPKHEHFERDVATWKTVRHYDIRSYDTVKPVCTEGLRHENFENRMGGNECRNEFEQVENREWENEQCRHEHWGNRCRGCRCRRRYFF